MNKNIKDFTEDQVLIFTNEQLPKNMQEEIEKYQESLRSDQPIPIDMQEDMQEKRQKIDKEMQELKALNQKEIQKFKESLPEESKEIYDNFIENCLQLLSTKEIVELGSETLAITEKLKERYIKEIQQKIQDFHKELEEKRDRQKFVSKIRKFLNELEEKLNKEFLMKSNEIYSKSNNINKAKIEVLQKKLSKSIENQAQKSKILQLVSEQLDILVNTEKLEILLQINHIEYVIKKEIIEKAFKISINHQEITQEDKENLESEFNHKIKSILKL